MRLTGWKSRCLMVRRRAGSVVAVCVIGVVSAAGVVPVAGGIAAAALGLSRDGAFVTAAYNDFLGRAPTAGELSSATSVPLDTAAERGSLVSRLSTSSEWIGVTVDKLYQDTLGRPADAGGKAYWVAATAKHGRTWVAYSLYQSSESCHTRVENMYAALLGRAPDSGGWDYWAGQVKAKGDLVLAAQLASSSEYYNRAWNRYGEATPTNVTASALLCRAEPDERHELRVHRHSVHRHRVEQCRHQSVIGAGSERWSETVRFVV